MFSAQTFIKYPTRGGSAPCDLSHGHEDCCHAQQDADNDPFADSRAGIVDNPHDCQRPARDR